MTKEHKYGIFSEDISYGALFSLVFKEKERAVFFKRLELFGFKSFAQKTKLDFEAGVTAIVGPNGVGKSNLLDALKWVLGEQSVRSIRGTRMEDVIFHGAVDIPPVGFAEVSLTISNQNKLLPLDYEEVTITRRIFRSGESEYLVNKIPVRLKDILELLMGTGLGLRSYSLMEQGKVDQILSSRPEERRDIFEEASGITKYKSKREEALRKLERTGENLQRIGDIIVEVKRQIKSMERQVNKARRYKQEFERLKEYELKVSQHQYQNFKKEKKDLENKISEWENKEASLNSKMDSSAYALENVKRDFSAVEENVSRIRAESYEISAAIKTAHNKASLDKERIEELTGRRENLKQQIQDLQRKIAATSKQIKDVQGQVEAAGQRKEEKIVLLTEKEENINNILQSVKEVQKKISEDKTEEMEVIAQQSRLRNELTKLTTDLANTNARLRRLNVESERTEEELNNIEEKQKACVGELGLLNNELKQLNREVWDLKSNLNVNLEKKRTLILRLQEASRQLTLFQSRLGFLKEMTKKYEGFSQGVRSILSAIESRELKIDGFCGVLVDLIEVLPQHQVSVEAALGENAQAIIVENWQAAETAISYLKEKDAGRAKFICLDSLKPHRGNLRPKSSLNRADEFVKAEPKYQRLLEYLLTHTFIVQDVEAGRRLIKDMNAPFRLVTLTGEILSGASITGGAFAKDFDSSLLGRREKIAQTEAELEKFKKDRSELENLKSSQEEEINKITSVVQEKEPILNKFKIQLANKENEKTNIEATKKKFQDEISVLKAEIDETDERRQQLQREQENLNQKLIHLQENQKELQLKVQNQQNFIAERNQTRQNILVEIAEAKTQAQALGREAEGTKVRLRMLLDSETEQKSSKSAREQEERDIISKIEQLKQEIEKLQLQDKDLSQAKLNVEEKLNENIEKRKTLSQTIQKLENSAREGQKELDQVRERKTNLRIRLTELNYKQNSLNEKMQQNYQVDLQATLEDTVEISPPEDSIFDEINRLKARLEGIGPINLVAIEENDQLQQRYSFLISQQEDLTRAQESLRKAITQINRTARQMFLETFQKVQISFKEYFRILFGGGDARLILLDENKILESGIEIVVRPPGKKLQNISLLSGGEKALTAIALLFAVFKVKPSPFCILDEVDAPLDEANIDRFTNLLSEFIKTSQFIIITHNKKTINMADVMYGITMEKSGVSKIVSVRFTEDKEVGAREMAEIEK